VKAVDSDFELEDRQQHQFGHFPLDYHRMCCQRVDFQRLMMIFVSTFSDHFSPRD
jgi:hypothetical protein